MNTLGQNCKYYRNKLGYTQQFVADKIKMSQSNYALIESDKRDPGTDTLVLIAKVLNTTPNDLLNIKSSNQVVKEIDKKLQDNQILMAANSKIDLGKLVELDDDSAKLVNSLIDKFLSRKKGD